MGLDVRVPLGLLFLLLGALLAGGGFFLGQAGGGGWTGARLDVLVGATMVLAGGVLFAIGRRQRWQDDPVTPRPWEREALRRRGR